MVTDTDRPRDAEARDAIIEATGRSVLVEAGAGTGKTRLVVDRILRGICDGRFELSGAVVITFTEKAAGELEARLRAAVAAALHRPGLGDADRERLRAALDELDSANIGTIHSFCARLLRERAAAAGVDPEFTVLDEAGAVMLRQECWRDWLDEQVATSPPALVTALRAGVKIAGLKGVADCICGTPEVLDGGLAVPRPERDLGAAAEALTAVAGRVLPLCDQHISKRTNEHARAFRTCCGGLVEAEPDDLRGIQVLACSLAATAPEKAITSFRKESREAVLPVLEECAAAARAVAAHLACDVFEWLLDYAGHYREAKAGHSALDFQDLLALAARMLRDNLPVRRYFQHRFSAFFVDEFQDTDPLQAELIAYLCERRDGKCARGMADVRLEDGKLMAVGDPKQSIYRFRRADVQMYEDFKGLYDAGDIHQIQCNFRSSSWLIEWFNHLFEHILIPSDQEGVYQAEHVPLMAPWPDMARGGAPVMVVCPPPELPAGEWNADVARRHEALYLARAVRALVEGEIAVPGHADGFSWRDFAFLFRALTDVGIYEDALDATGIPYRLVGGRRFYSRGPVVAALEVLKAVDDPLNEMAIVAALRSPFFGISDEELMRYRTGGRPWNYLVADRRAGPVGEALGLLADWHARRNSVSPQALLREIFDATKALQSVLLKPDGRQRAACLEKLLVTVRGLAATNHTFSSMVGYLSSVQESEIAEEEAGVVEPGDDFLSLLTMHKAKGLEFPVVVLPDVTRETRGKVRGGALLVNRRRASAAFKVQGGIESENFPALAAEEAGNSQAETARVLYVACTRAERLLVLPLHWRLNARKPGIEDLLTGTGLFAAPGEVPFGVERAGVYYLDTRGWRGELNVSLSPRKSVSGNEQEAEALLADRRAWEEAHRALAARASAAEPVALPSALGPEHEAAAGARTGAAGAGAAFGTLFHNLMGSVPLVPGKDGAAEQLVRRLAESEADRLDMDGEAAQRAAEMALASLRHRDFRSLLAAADWIEQEVGFSAPLAAIPGCPDGTPGFVEGSVDVLVGGPDGTTVLDYKTDRVQAAGAEAAAGRHWLQLALYGLAMRACRRAGEDVRLAVFFVRPGRLVTRALDAELADAVVRAVARAADGAG